MNYGDKHTEDSLSSRLGRLYGIAPGSRQKMAEEVIRMEETMVIMEQYYSEYDSPIISYVCGECGEKFLDRDDNYKFCPHCGRKIVDEKE